LKPYWNMHVATDSHQTVRTDGYDSRIMPLNSPGGSTLQ